jgi:hypothetical protein
MVELRRIYENGIFARTIAGLRPMPHNGAAIIETSVAALHNTDVERFQTSCTVNYQ